MKTNSIIEKKPIIDSKIDCDMDSYRVQITRYQPTPEEIKTSKVIAKFVRQSVIANRELEDKMILILLNDKPKRMSDINWYRMVRKVLRKEVIDNNFIGVPND